MGRPLGSLNKTVKPAKDRLLSKITKDENDCWIMQPYKGHRYPALRINNKDVRAHRLSYELFNNCIIPENIHCLHKCDNTKCINPDHLFLGTHNENMQDMIVKGRDKKEGPKGERCAQHVLDEKTVIKIIEELKAGNRISELARKYGVSSTTISHIKTNDTWQYIKRG